MDSVTRLGFVIKYLKISVNAFHKVINSLKGILVHGNKY